MKTIKQIAEENDVSKTAIRKHMPESFRKQFAETVRGVIYISEQGETLIKSKLHKNEVETNRNPISSNSSANQSETVSEVSGTLPDTVCTLISAMQNELEIKNRQIQELQKENSKLTEKVIEQSERILPLIEQAQKLAENAQTLHAMENVKPQLIDNQQESIEERINEKKTNFFSRLFSRGVNDG